MLKLLLEIVHISNSTSTLWNCKMSHQLGDIFFLLEAVRVRSWFSSFCTVITYGHSGKKKWNERYRFLLRWVGCLCPIILFLITQNISPSVCSPTPPPNTTITTTTCFSYQTFFATLSYFLHPSLHPCQNPSHSHLSNSYPLLSISSSSPINPALLLLAWLIAETEPILCRAACRHPLQPRLLPPHIQPLYPLITPHCKGIISGRDWILKHDRSVLVFKWSWSCWFLIRGAEDA